ncbi:MAG: DUF4465 domain-containing protein [Saprospiraceae bacterium]|nr:DUF4465 domain-containing protein [Lewinella sp.]
MKQALSPLLFCALFSTAALMAQTTATFENFDIAAESFLNDSDGSGGFSDGNIFLPNTYVDDPSFPYWTGWVISNTTDTLTAGFTNQYSAITGGGYDGSATYAITYASPATTMQLTGDAQGGGVAGMYITNSTYAYLSMRDGDSFTKKFGGETGDDPDYFLLTIKKYLNGELGPDSVNVYLADYRFEDNSQDYILDDWTFVDLTPLGDLDSLQFSMSGSDVGQYGLNTPAYVCVDNITTLDRPTSVRAYLPDLAIRIYPNPTANLVNIDWREDGPAQGGLFDFNGMLVSQQSIVTGIQQIDLQHLPNGTYILKVQTPKGFISRRLMKL